MKTHDHWDDDNPMLEEIRYHRLIKQFAAGSMEYSEERIKQDMRQLIWLADHQSGGVIEDDIGTMSVSANRVSQLHEETIDALAMELGIPIYQKLRRIFPKFFRWQRNDMIKWVLKKRFQNGFYNPNDEETFRLLVLCTLRLKLKSPTSRSPSSTP